MNIVFLTWDEHILSHDSVPRDKIPVLEELYSESQPRLVTI
jgi:hypothetical protein